MAHLFLRIVLREHKALEESHVFVILFYFGKLGLTRGAEGVNGQVSSERD